MNFEDKKECIRDNIPGITSIFLEEDSNRVFTNNLSLHYKPLEIHFKVHNNDDPELLCSNIVDTLLLEIDKVILYHELAVTSLNNYKKAIEG